jgi:hypothetical protein
MNITTKRIALESASCVCVTFGDMGDADTNKPLFNDTAWKKADNILREILEGLTHFRPTGTFVLHIQIRQDGSPVTTKYGFRLLHCNRGTNDVHFDTHVSKWPIVGYPNLRVSDIF